MPKSHIGTALSVVHVYNEVTSQDLQKKESH